MSNDLEEFLRKAAERRLARQKTAASPNTNSSATPASSQGNSTGAAQPTILEHVVSSDPQQSLGPRLKSHIHPESVLSNSIDQADDRVRERIHQQFDHTVSTIDAARPEKKKSSNQSKKSSKNSQKPSNTKSPEAISSYEESRNDMTIERAESKMIATGSMMDLLRDPQTLRTAFIASQIFERKF